MQATRLDTVLAHVKRVHSLCSVLGEDFSDTIQGVHPSLREGGVVHNKSVSSETLKRLEAKMAALLEEKKRRMHRVTFNHLDQYGFSCYLCPLTLKENSGCERSAQEPLQACGTSESCAP